MKTIGWIVTLLGSNGLTGALVARNNLRFALFENYPWLESLAENLTGIAGFFGLNGIAEGIADIQRDVQRYVQLVNAVFYISLVVLVIGLTLLTVGYIMSARKRKQLQG